MIFVSYSWVNEKPDETVLQLVAKLRKNGYEAECDVMKIQEHASINFVEMMARNLQEAEKVIVVLSETYKRKADSFSGGVGEEYRYIIGNISKETNKYILVSFDRNLENVQPKFLSRNQVIFLDDDDGFNQLLFKLNNIGEYSFPEVNPNKTIPIIQHINSQKDEYNLLRGNRYNLLVSSCEDAWEADSYQLERSRCLTSYTSKTIKEVYGELGIKQIAEIKSYPCIFAYEDYAGKNAYIGYITDMVIREKAIKFYFQKQGVLTYDDLHKYAFEFDIELTGSITELMHTHWTIKDINLVEEIKKRGISVLPYKDNGLKETIMPSNSKELLKILLMEDNPVDYMGELFEKADDKMDSRLRAMMRDLKDKGYLTSWWADNVPYRIDFNERAYSFKN
ncbi:TIR domain-containing protein [Clostridium sp. MCC353]|uniref:toll/interleukin-1 receptor domain-containing protein n=1 Tax=Clostridium sp. MCC353 TaxID=2592646 RepID=UPI001C012B1E|nr:toll/interleukin-1 receptor domain-containing protein [Clostridium sp. MCC353]MBT9779627.1 TIR domain-containing protein [Clostridium sp. MCC353]